MTASSGPPPMSSSGTPTLSFADHFWGADDRGFDVLYAHMSAAKDTSKLVLEILETRARLEEEYAKGLQRLAKAIAGLGAGGAEDDADVPAAVVETTAPRSGSDVQIAGDYGSTKSALVTLRNEISTAAQAHQLSADTLRTEVAKPLDAFISDQSIARKQQGKIMQSAQKRLKEMKANALRAKKNESSKARAAEVLAESLERVNSQRNEKEAEKVQKKYRKAMAEAAAAEREHSEARQRLFAAHQQWTTDMVTTAALYQSLEEARLDTLRAAIWAYTNAVATTCVANDQSCERIRGSLEQCQFGRDLDIFVRRNGTGTSRPDADGNLVAAGNLDAPPSARTTLSHRPPSLTGSLTSLSSSAGSTGSAPPTETLPSSLDDTASVASFPPASAVSDAGAPPPYFNSSQAPLFYARALYDYDAQSAEEIFLREGDHIAVYETHEEPWWRGVVVESASPDQTTGRSGVFPANFTEQC
ncbi:hypothetical protein H696_01678 [Fonticula alba]|uniref:SH3 domain-containing protein n=1 Tax=Fonticula alba TaxID=691883 RepID=A0A058ZCZ2_FONAL|nr:hypothetical protein H696_01678 [Fonticula alba]KCV72280.1 hypothetical protein H696_01678 [Fonticula alba]|eukprot:XP_009493858.1 hypothetical protein H696_01678 [Fonticula alba]